MEGMMIFAAISAFTAAQDPFQFEEKYDPLVQEAARNVAVEAVREMRFSHSDRTLLIVPLTGDVKEIVTNTLGSAILNTQKFVGVQRSTWDEIMTKLGIKDPIRQVQSSKEAIRVGRAYKADYVLFGRVYPGLLHREQGKVDLEVHFRIVKVPTEGDTIEGVFIGTYRTREEPGLLSIVHHRIWIREYSPVTRIIVWAIVMLSLPFAILMFKEMIGGSKPLLPVIFVVLFTGADILLSFVMMGFEIDGIFQAGLFVFGMASSLFWNLFVVAKVGQMSAGYGTH